MESWPECPEEDFRKETYFCHILDAHVLSSLICVASMSPALICLLFYIHFLLNSQNGRLQDMYCNTIILQLENAEVVRVMKAIKILCKYFTHFPIIPTVHRFFFLIKLVPHALSCQTIFKPHLQLFYSWRTRKLCVL